LYSTVYFFTLKCTKFYVSTDPAGETYSAPPDLAVFRAPTSKGRSGKGEEGKEEGNIGKQKEGGMQPIPYYYSDLEPIAG